jgi:tetratricopeptide (TPR) repeat protein/transcriptional regulator with XRE-family HTH domain
MKKLTTTPNLHLKRARKLQGWSQEDVAREIGTDAFTISRWERGVTLPSPHFRQKLAALFGLSIEELGLVEETVESAPEQEPGQPQEQTAFLPITPPSVFDPAIPPPLARDRGLVGRDDLLHAIKQELLNSRPVALSALNGLPGVGKTALATALAHHDEVRAHFSDGILWAGLGYEPDVLSQLSRWGTLLNCAPSDLTQRSRPQAWAENIHRAIGQRRMLLVIDDAWEIAEALAFKVGGENCAHLVTTRFPELARRFAPQNAIVVRELGEAAGQELLTRLAPEAVQAELEATRVLMTAVGGLPLALTLLGNFLRAQTHSGQPRRLRAALERLRQANERLRLNEPQPLIGGHPSLPSGTPLSLQAVIGLSDQQVSKEAQATLRALAVFPPKPNTFSEEAALAVSDLPVEALDELTDAGLLESSGPERYTLHQTIADYARAHLTDMEAVKRLIDYFVRYTEKHEEDYAALEGERSNILAALEAAPEQDSLPELVRGVHAFTPLLIAHGLYTVAETQLQRSLQAAQTGDDSRGQATAWLYLGKIAEQRGNYLQAQMSWQNGLKLAREGGHHRNTARILQELGSLAWSQGQLPQAHQFLSEALEMQRQLEDQRGVADTLKNLGNLAAEQGQPEQAYQLYGEALEAFQQLGDQRGVAITRHNLGILAREQGQPEQARQLYEEALSILRDLGDQRSSAVVLSNLGHLLQNQGQLEPARQILEEALAIHRRLENRHGLAFALLNLGNVAMEQEQHTQADRYLQEALTILHDLQAQRGFALVLQARGILSGREGQYNQADQYLQEALTIFRTLQDQRQEALTLREIALLERKGERFEQAYQILNEVLVILLHLGDRREVAATRLELALLARQQGRQEQEIEEC